MEKFNDRRIVTKLINTENTIQVVDNIDDLMQNVAREAVMADMMLPAWYVGWEQIYDNIAVQYATVNDNKHVMREMSVATRGEMAAILMNIELDQFHDGAPRVFAFRQLDIFRKKGERWLAVQAHCYVPVDPETGDRAKGALPVREPLQWPQDAVPAPATSEEQAKTELRAWFESRISAANAEDVMRHFGSGDDAVVYSPYLPGEHRGLAEIRKHFAAELEDVVSVKADVTDYHVATDGRMGAIISRQNRELTLRDGSVRRVSVRHSDCLRRVDGRWFSMIEMTSFPTDLKTGRPVTWLGDNG
jgi:ketosteroid isomerase-like protein